MFPIYHGVMLPESSFVGVLNSYVQDSPDFPEGADTSRTSASICTARHQDGNSYMYCRDSDLSTWLESSIGPNGTSWSDAGLTSTANYGRITSSLKTRKYLFQVGFTSRYLYLEGVPVMESPSGIAAYPLGTEDPITGELYLRYGTAVKKFNGQTFDDTLYSTGSLLSTFKFCAYGGKVYSVEAVSSSPQERYLSRRDGTTGEEDSRILSELSSRVVRAISVDGSRAAVVTSSSGAKYIEVLDLNTAGVIKTVVIPNEDLEHGFTNENVASSLSGNILYLATTHSSNKHVLYEIALGVLV